MPCPLGCPQQDSVDDRLDHILSLLWLSARCLKDSPCFLASRSVLFTDLPFFCSRVLVVVAELDTSFLSLVGAVKAGISFPHRSHEGCVRTLSAVDFEFLVLKVTINEETTHWTFLGKIRKGMVDDVEWWKLAVRLHDCFEHMVDCCFPKLGHIILVTKDKETGYL